MLDDLAVLNGDGEAARVGTVERARRLDDRRRTAERLARASAMQLLPESPCRLR